MLGQRERAVNEYSKAKTKPTTDTGSAQQVAEGFLKKAYSEGGTPVAAPRGWPDAKTRGSNSAARLRREARFKKSPILLSNKNRFAGVGSVALPRRFHYPKVS